MRVESLIVRGHGLDVDIPLRPLTILLGANDSGKSTLINGLSQALRQCERRGVEAGSG